QFTPLFKEVTLFVTKSLFIVMNVLKSTFFYESRFNIQFQMLSLNLFTIFYLLTTPIYIYNIWSFYQLRFGNNNESLLKNTIFCIVSYGLVSGTYLLIEIPTATLIMNVFCGYLISRLFSQNLIQQLAETLVLIVIFISIEILVVTLLNFFTIDYQDASSYQSII